VATRDDPLLAVEIQSVKAKERPPSGELTRWSGEARDFLLGALHLGSLSNYMNSTQHGDSDIEGLVWSDVLHVLTTHRSSLKTPEQGSIIYTQALAAVTRTIPPELPRPCEVAIIATMLASYPENVSPEVIGLGKIVEGKRAPNNDIVARTVQNIVQLYNEDVNLMWISMRTLGEVLYVKMSHVAVPRLISSLENWLTTHTRTSNEASVVNNLLDQLKYPNLETGTCTIMHKWADYKTIRPLCIQQEL